MEETLDTPLISIADLIQIPEARNEKVLNRRQELIKKFVDRINADRSMAGYKPLTARFIATKMYSAGLKTDDRLWWFWGYLNEGKNFSSAWWWLLDPKNCNELV